jgi:hypothetical protein
MAVIKSCYICQQQLKKGDKVFATLEGKVVKKGVYDYNPEDDSEPLIVCEKCGKELDDAVETLKRYKEIEKKEAE